jgi:hypothetical protein
VIVTLVVWPFIAIKGYQLQKRKRASCTDESDGTRTLRWRPIVAVVGVVVVAAALFGAVAIWGHDDPQGPSDADAATLQRVIRNTMQSSTYLTPDIKQQFWDLLDKYSFSESDARDMRATIAGPGTDYIALYWKDAIISLDSQAAFKSSERKDAEDRLIKLHVVSQSFITGNDLKMQSISQRKSISVNGGSVIVTKDIAAGALSQVDDAVARLDQLFTRP